MLSHGLAWGFPHTLAHGVLSKFWYHIYIKKKIYSQHKDQSEAKKITKLNDVNRKNVAREKKN